MRIGTVRNMKVLIQSDVQNVHIDKHTFASKYVEKFHAVHYRLQQNSVLQ